MLDSCDCCLTETEREADLQAHLGRVAILGVDLGRWGTRAMLWTLQFFGIFARA